MENTNENPLRVLKEQVTEYIDLKSEQTRLEAIESMAKVAAYSVGTAITVLLVLLCVLSLVVACSLFIGQWLHNYGLGFLISAVIYLALLLIYKYAIRKSSETSIMNRIIRLTNEDHEK
jgi:hypothetical protein